MRRVDEPPRLQPSRGPGGEAIGEEPHGDHPVVGPAEGGGGGGCGVGGGGGFSVGGGLKYEN